MENQQKNNPEKELTLSELAKMMQAGFESSDKKFVDLAKEMQIGFKKSERMTDEKIEGLAQIISKSFDKVENDLSELKTDVTAIKTDVSEIKTTMDHLEANLNKKVDKVDHNTLTYRVEKLEKKFA